LENKVKTAEILNAHGRIYECETEINSPQIVCAGRISAELKIMDFCGT